MKPSEFGQLALKAVREDLIKKKWARANINKQVAWIRIFRWGISEELVSPTVYQALIALAVRISA